MKKKKIIITGGAGFIGSNIAEELVKRGCEVKIIDDLSTGHAENLSGIRDRISFVEGSITDLEMLKKEFAGFDCVLHHAALVSVPRSVKDPLATSNANIIGTLNVLVAARDCGVKRLINISSSSVYGDTPALLKHEGMKPDPLSPYAVSKLSAEQLAKVFFSLYGLETLSIRYFNVFGPRQDPDSEYAAVIPKFITAMLKGESPVIFGDGKQSRDFTFVKNVVDANICAIEAERLGGESINIATSDRITLLELVDRINHVLGKDIRPEFAGRRPGDIMHSCADVSLAKKVIGFEPGYSFEEGLKKTIEWFQGTESLK